MPDNWFDLSPSDQADALELAAGQSGRPAHLLEKDIWLVWTLSVLYSAPFANGLTFKGGTSLSKVYRVINRFSEDVDLTYDIRSLLPSLVSADNPIPANRSQVAKISGQVRTQLPAWIRDTVKPHIEAVISATGLEEVMQCVVMGTDKLRLDYAALKQGTGYASTSVLLEFGARATGEPHRRYQVSCDIAPHIAGVTFPAARPLVMSAERTFWEKVTAIHVYCKQGQLKAERLARHWYDVAALADRDHFNAAIIDSALAYQVAEHKTAFFPEKDAEGNHIDYIDAVTGALQLVPAGRSRNALEEDYRAMIADGLLPDGHPAFAELMDRCVDIQMRINESAAAR